MRRIIMISALVWLIALAVFFAAPVRAADYPTRAITLICPVTPGGSLDLNARAFASVAEKHLGKPVVVVNKPGGSGAVGTMGVVEGKPDGYTICLGWPSQTAIIIGEVVNGRKPPFIIDDFAILGRMTNSPPLFNVKYDSPWKNLQELIADLKSHPPKTYKLGASGIYSIGHLPMEIMNKELGVKIQLVPVRGGGESIALQLGGHTHFSCRYPGPSLPLVSAKQMRVLASFGEKRIKYFEDVPTFKELGYPKIFFYSWYGLLAHKDTPAPILERLRKLVKDVTQDPAFLSMMDKTGDLVDYADAEGTKKAWLREYDQIFPLIKELEMEKKEKEKKQ
jgi:tripartite-type tricarboxylate transporter receptor subunit TctC